MYNNYYSINILTQSLVHYLETGLANNERDYCACSSIYNAECFKIYTLKLIVSNPTYVLCIYDETIDKGV